MLRSRRGWIIGRKVVEIVYSGCIGSHILISVSHLERILEHKLALDDSHFASLAYRDGQGVVVKCRIESVRQSIVLLIRLARGRDAMNVIIRVVGRHGERMTV